MSKQAPALTSKGLAPIKPEFIAAIRRTAESLGWNLDQLAQQIFSRAVDQLTIDEGFKLSGRIATEVDERRKGPKADGPHDVECVGCRNPYRCFCDRQHEEGICPYCHEGTTKGYQMRLANNGRPTMNS